MKYCIFLLSLFTLASSHAMHTTNSAQVTQCALLFTNEFGKTCEISRQTCAFDNSVIYRQLLVINSHPRRTAFMYSAESRPTPNGNVLYKANNGLEKYGKEAEGIFKTLEEKYTKIAAEQAQQYLTLLPLD